jgi:hypothetical protein
MRWIIINVWVWVNGVYIGYILRPPKVTERHVKVICIPDSDTEAKPGDSIEFNVEDWIELKKKIKTEQIKRHQ